MLRADSQRQQEAAVRRSEKLSKERAAAEKAEKCRRARDRFLLFTEVSRVFRRDVNGQRVYYTSAEIDAERTSTQLAMTEACTARSRQ
jgi:hypothetical protein